MGDGQRGAGDFASDTRVCVSTSHGAYVKSGTLLGSINGGNTTHAEPGVGVGVGVSVGIDLPVSHLSPLASAQVASVPTPVPALRPWCNGKTIRSPADRSRVLAHLHAALTAHAHELEPRLGPMIEWVGRQTRSRFKGVLRDEAVPLSLTVSELQVNLCEWRKFLTVDKRRQARRGSILCSSKSS